MKKIYNEEKQIIGKWIKDTNGKIIEDENCKRIKWLIENQLRKIAVSKEYGDWQVLFVNIDDGNYWERVYLEGELQGGGPPSLILISKEEAIKKYQMLL